jgi:mRNA interferase RelE/StbE
MNYIPTNAFKKSARRLDAQTRSELAQIVAQIETANSIADLPNLKDMKGGKNKGFYRIRFGEYRLGIFLTDEGDVILREVGPRGDFYKMFP